MMLERQEMAIARDNELGLRGDRAFDYVIARLIIEEVEKWSLPPLHPPPRDQYRAVEFLSEFAPFIRLVLNRLLVLPFPPHQSPTAR